MIMKNKKFIFIITLFIIIVFGYSVLSTRENSFNTISATEALRELNNDDNIVLIDVREEEDYEFSRIKGSILIPLGELEKRIVNEVPDQETRIFVYCQRGVRSRTASRLLTDLGYINVYNVGGIEAWVEGLEYPEFELEPETVPTEVE